MIGTTDTFTVTESAATLRTAGVEQHQYLPSKSWWAGKFQQGLSHLSMGLIKLLETFFFHKNSGTF